MHYTVILIIKNSRQPFAGCRELKLLSYLIMLYDNTHSFEANFVSIMWAARVVRSVLPVMIAQSAPVVRFVPPLSK